jgi:hypothetical protein
MKAAVFFKYGSPDVISIAEVKNPKRRTGRGIWLP